MKRNIPLWQFAGFVISTFLGTILHFLYDWTNQSIIISLFSAVNESTWEHMKLLYFPMLVFALIQSRYFADFSSFWCIKLVGMVLGLITIPTLFYGYNSILSTSPAWINIAIFFVSAATAYFIEWVLFQKNIQCNGQKSAFTLILFIGFLFILFTFVTPRLPLFQNPINGTYGISMKLIN